jgi:hypothetical protein
MEEEYFLNRAAIVHGGMAARCCYCIVIHLFVLEYILQSNIILGEGGDDLKSVTLEQCIITKQYNTMKGREVWYEEEK